MPLKRKRAKTQSRGAIADNIDQNNKIWSAILATIDNKIGLRRFILAVIFICAVIWGGAVIIAGDLHGKAWRSSVNYFANYSAKHGFVAEKFTVNGRHYIDLGWLRARMRDWRGQPIFTLSLDEMNKSLMAHPWIKEVQVKRFWPDRIVINLTEKKPFLYELSSPNRRHGRAIRADEKLILLDEDGAKIGLYERSLFPNIAVIGGASAFKKSDDILELVNAEPAIKDRLEYMVYVGKRRWDLWMDNGICIKLPEKNTALAMRKIAKAHKEHGLFDRKLASIDLRDGERIVLEVISGRRHEFPLTGDEKPL